MLIQRLVMLPKRLLLIEKKPRIQLSKFQLKARLKKFLFHLLLNMKQTMTFLQDRSKGTKPQVLVQEIPIETEYLDGPTLDKSQEVEEVGEIGKLLLLQSIL